jgi:hypothetical protein
MALNYKKFDKEILSFLKTQPQKFGDISHIANNHINGDINIKQQVIRQLYYLRDRDIIIIKDLPDDPDKVQNDWWGTLLGHNPLAGYKVEDLKAQLSAGYEKLSWFDKNPIKSKLLDWLVPFILGIVATLVTQKIFQTDEKNNSKPTSYNSLFHNKDTLKKHSAKFKDTTALQNSHLSKPPNRDNIKR